MTRVISPIAFLLLAPSLALAVARHDTPLRIAAAKVSGKPGFKLKLVLRPENGYTRVRVGLGRMTTKGIQGMVTSDRKRRLAADLEPGYLRAMIGEITGL